MRDQYNRVGTPKIQKTKFDLSYEKLFTCDMGSLIPVLAEECLPGDVWSINNQVVARMSPLVAPILHDINMDTHYFFVPYRILDDKFIEFITGGIDGDDDTTLDRWIPTGSATDKNSLWDYFGFPITETPGTPVTMPGTEPLLFPVSAYNKVWNYYYRDQTLQDERENDDDTIARRNWEKDYFTASLPWQQRGTAGSIPLTGMASAEWGLNNFDQIGVSDPSRRNIELFETAFGQSKLTIHNLDDTTNDSDEVLQGVLNNNTIDVSNIGTFNIADLRLLTQIQLWQELNARAGVRFPEFIQAQFDTKIPDYKIQEPEYLGGTQQPLIISEVLQTSESNTTPQGTLSGHGITASRGTVGKYRCQEHGIIIGLMSIMPKPKYSQGVNRQFTRQTRFDFPFPMFANLSEQEVLQQEIYLTSGDQEENEKIFGFIGRYDECRIKHDIICSEMRDTFDYWHISRQFGNAPMLNSSFLECNPRKDIFAVPSEHGFKIQFANKIHAVRPLPYMSNPSLL